MTPKDVKFLFSHVRRHGVDVVIASIFHDPVLLMEILEGGWSNFVRDNNLYNSREFLSNLCHLQAPEDAIKVLNMYFEGSSTETVNSHLMYSSANHSDQSPILSWLKRSELIKETVVTALLKTASNVGADFDFCFTHTSFDNKKGKHASFDHSILSAAMCDSTSARLISDLSACNTKAVLLLLKLGKKFDKPTAAALMRFEHTIAQKWVNLFLDQGATSASQILKLTSRMDVPPVFKAWLSSKAAMEAINSLMSPSEKPSTPCPI